jgi:hypothetical protein
MKKLKFTLLGTAMMIFSANTFAQYVDGGTTGTLTWQLTGVSPNYTLTISGNDTMPNYNWYDSPWYSYRSAITTAVINSGVTSIGDYAFSNCSGLTSVTIPNSVTTIGYWAFANCTKLQTVNFNAINCTTMGSSSSLVFSGDTAFTTLNIGNRVKRIPDLAFANCSSLTSVTIPNSVTTIGDYAFSGCSGLTSVTIGIRVATIGQGAFSWCTNLDTITCTRLTPPTIQSITFNNVPSTAKVYVPCPSVSNYKAASYWSSFGNNITAIPGTCPTTTDTITATATAGGSITPSGTVLVTEGTDQKFTFAPNNCYLTDSLWIDNVYSPDSISKGSYTFNNVLASHSIKVSFKALPADTGVISSAICYGKDYNLNGFSLTNQTASGTHYRSTQKTNGCDSVVKLNLTVYPNVSVTPLSASFCTGKTYLFGTKTLTTAEIGRAHV